MLMRSIKALIASLTLMLLLHEPSNTSANTSLDHNLSNLWTTISKVTQFFFVKCFQGSDKLHGSTDDAGRILEDCLKRKGVRALDRILSRDIIEITDNIVLVKRENATANDHRDRELQRWKRFKPLQEISADWNKEFTEKITHFLRTRVIKITFKGSHNATNDSEARHRHKQNDSFGQMMTFGLVAAGLIVIPLGFQFLAVLGGKALLLAKLALLLTSIQGLKKIATSHVNYGLYSTAHGSPYHYDRQWYYEGDRRPSYYSSASGSPYSDYGHSSVLSYSSLHPRDEQGDTYHT